MSPGTTDWGDILVQSVPRAWASAVGEGTLARIREIGRLLSKRVGRERIVPAPREVFRALETPIDGVRVLLVGQDPYPTLGHAMGLSFSVPRGVTPLPPTAKNILRELADDLGSAPATHCDLTAWARQGVLLLNRHLTTAAGSPGAHHLLGWAAVTDRIVEVARAHNPNMVAIIWGRAAEEVVPALDGASTLRSAHPSPLSAHRGFFGSRPFSKANGLLAQHGLAPINWSLD